MNTPNPHPPESAEALNTHARAVARRAALVKGLRAGGVAVAGGASLNAFAARVATSNGTQCTVSGQASAAISNPANGQTAPCAGFRPAHFFTPGSHIANLASDYNIDTADGRKLLITPEFIAVQNSGVGGAKLTPVNWPSIGATALTAATVRTIFPAGTDNTPLLYALALGDDLSFFIAAYFSASSTFTPNGATRLPFSPADVVKHYNSGALNPDAVKLYRLVCVG